LKYGLIYKNEHSYKDHGLVMQSVDRSLLPAVKRQQVDIPSLDGKYDLQADPIYDDRIISVSFSAVVNSPEQMQAKKREVAKWLSGRARLIFDDEPWLWNDAKVFEAIAFEQTFKTLTVTAAFEAKPFAYGKEVIIPVTAPAAVKMKYAGNARTPTKITLKNTGSVNISGLSITAVLRVSGRGTA